MKRSSFVDFIKGLLLVTLLAPLSRCGDDFDPALCADSGEFLHSITPGENIDYMKLGEPYGCIIERYGAPGGTGTGDITEPYIFLFYYDTLGLSGFVKDIDESMELDRSDEVIMLFAKAPYTGTTEGGNGIGASRVDVEEEFGVCEEEEVDEEGLVNCLYPGIGISFEFLDDLVVDIWIY